MCADVIIKVFKLKQKLSKNDLIRAKSKAVTPALV